MFELAACMKLVILIHFSHAESTDNRVESTTKSYQHENAYIADVVATKEEILKAELVSLADGFRIIVPCGPEGVNRDERITATAIVNMLTNLDTMEQMDEIMAHSCLHTTISFLTDKEGFLELDEKKAADKSSDHIKQLFVQWLQSIVALVEKEPRLREEYAKLKDEADFLISDEPSATAVSDREEKRDRILKSSLFRRSVLNELFLKQSVDHSKMIDQNADHRKKFLLARTLIDLAKRHGMAKKLNLVYRRTLEQVAEQFSISVSEKEKCDILFTQLEKNIKVDRELYEEVKSCEKTLHVWYSFRLLRCRNSVMYNIQK